MTQVLKSNIKNDPNEFVLIESTSLFRTEDILIGSTSLFRTEDIIVQDKLNEPKLKRFFS
jgi:hypothetical protein